MKTINALVPRQDFPLLANEKHAQLSYLDNAATTQKPRVVLDAMQTYYETSNANVSRGVHKLAEQSTRFYETSRDTVAKFFNVASRNVVFTSGSTDALNLIASWFRETLKKDDVILLSLLEHHSNIVPWQAVARKTQARVDYIELDSSMHVDMNSFSKKITTAKVLCISHISNVLGTLQPIKKMIDEAHKHGVYVVVDGSQAAGHIPLDLKELDADFYVFSAHKMLGPMGVGALILSDAVIDVFDPLRMGGGMIETVTKESFTKTTPPHCFEAGTPNVAGAVGLAKACEYITTLTLDAIHKHECSLAKKLREELKKIPQVSLFPKEFDENTAGIVSFTLDSVHPHDVAQILDSHNVAIRSGMHCAMPLHHALEVDALNRVSFSVYNSSEDIAQIMSALKEALRIFGNEVSQ